MLELHSFKLYNLDSCNKELFLADQSTKRIIELEGRIKTARADLLRLMRELEAAKAQPAIQPISKDVLESFFKEHPAMWIELDHGIISLISKNQSVAFHTARGRNSAGQNDDIIYVTLPLYGFRLDFHPDGRVSGKALSSDTLKAIAGDDIQSFGHPHATKPNALSCSFQSICNGNNRFIQDWHKTIIANSLSGPTLMRLMSQAAVWMETANLSDMYGTPLAEKIPTPELHLEAAAAMRLYQEPERYLHETPEFLQGIYNHAGKEFYKRCMYAIWLYRRYRDLHGKIALKDALFHAIAADILVMNSRQLRNCVGESRAELGRTNEISTRSYTELCNFRPHGSDRTMADLYPEIFHTEEHHA